jgi:hypothetical protein
MSNFYDTGNTSISMDRMRTLFNITDSISWNSIVGKQIALFDGTKITVPAAGTESPSGFNYFSNKYAKINSYFSSWNIQNDYGYRGPIDLNSQSLAITCWAESGSKTSQIGIRGVIGIDGDPTQRRRLQLSLRQRWNDQQGQLTCSLLFKNPDSLTPPFAIDQTFTDWRNYNYTTSASETGTSDRLFKNGDNFYAEIRTAVGFYTNRHCEANLTITIVNGGKYA